MKVLVACEFSGIVRDAFAAKGHESWSCDLEPSETPGNHFIGDVLPVLEYGWDLLIAHPPCTFLSNAGVRHLHSTPSRNGVVAKINGEERWNELYKAADFFKRLINAPIDKICVENPVPSRYSVEAIGRKYNQIIQPWQFGHGETKATCLWLKNLPPLVPTNIVSGREHRIHKMSPSPTRSRERSRTYPGIAAAMAEQWGRNEKDF